MSRRSTLNGCETIACLNIRCNYQISNCIHFASSWSIGQNAVIIIVQIIFRWHQLSFNFIKKLQLSLGQMAIISFPKLQSPCVNEYLHTLPTNHHLRKLPTFYCWASLGSTIIIAATAALRQRLMQYYAKVRLDGHRQRHSHDFAIHLFAQRSIARTPDWDLCLSVAASAFETLSKCTITLKALGVETGNLHPSTSNLDSPSSLFTK